MSIERFTWTANDFEFVEPIDKFNPYHDEHGRFSESDSRGDASTGIGISREAAQDSARQVSKDLGFDASRIDISSENKTFVLNGQTYFYAGSADISSPARNDKGEVIGHSDGRITLYSSHLSLEAVDGVVAHEIMHEKFQAVLDAVHEENKLVMTDPGPPPDPNGVYPWQRSGGGNAVMAPDGSLRAGYKEKYPLYQAMWEAYDKYSIADFATSDGSSNYSAEYWKGWRNGEIKTDIAFHETLAEMARVKYTTGKFPDHLGSMAQGNWKPTSTARAKVGNPYGHKIWRDLYRTVNKLYSKLRKS